MRLAAVVAVLITLAATATASATALVDVDRSIGREPDYQSQSVRYCLLVFGPEAKTRVWLVQDGDRLYVDRNGDGDLTGPDEQVIADPKWSSPERGTFLFTAGDIRDGSCVHKDLSLNILQIDHLAADDEHVRAALAGDPSVRGYVMTLDVDMAEWKGSGLDGRVSQTCTVRDSHGLLQFGDSPERAPVLHFGGPWHATLYGSQILRVGRETDLILGVGTPGVGPGTTVFTSYGELIPEAACPVVEISYRPQHEGDPPVRERYELKHRC